MEGIRNASKKSFELFVYFAVYFNVIIPEELVLH